MRVKTADTAKLVMRIAAASIQNLKDLIGVFGNATPSEVPRTNPTAIWMMNSVAILAVIILV